MSYVCGVSVNYGRYIIGKLSKLAVAHQSIKCAKHKQISHQSVVIKQHGVVLIWLTNDIINVIGITRSWSIKRDSFANNDMR